MTEHTLQDLIVINEDAKSMKFFSISVSFTKKFQDVSISMNRNSSLKCKNLKMKEIKTPANCRKKCNGKAIRKASEFPSAKFCCSRYIKLRGAASEH